MGEGTLNVLRSEFSSGLIGCARQGFNIPAACRDAAVERIIK